MDEIMLDEIITLQQQMDKLAADEIVHIGSKSGYFFCGTKAEYEANIDAVSDELLAEMKRVRQNLLGYKTRFPKNFEKLTEFDPTTGDEDALRKLARTALLMSNGAEKVIQANRRLPIVEQNIAEFKQVRERIVLDFYPCLEEADGWNVVVEGIEEGQFWTLDEYRNGVKEDDNA